MIASAIFIESISGSSEDVAPSMAAVRTEKHRSGSFPLAGAGLEPATSGFCDVAFWVN